MAGQRDCRGPPRLPKGTPKEAWGEAAEGLWSWIEMPNDIDAAAGRILTPHGIDEVRHRKAFRVIKRPVAADHRSMRVSAQTHNQKAIALLTKAAEAAKLGQTVVQVEAVEPAVVLKQQVGALPRVHWRAWQGWHCGRGAQRRALRADRQMALGSGRRIVAAEEKQCEYGEENWPDAVHGRSLGAKPYRTVKSGEAYPTEDSQRKTARRTGGPLS